MSHDTHSGHSKENKTIISFKNSFWLIIIIVGLFIAALNFVQAESHGEEKEGHEGGAKTESTHEMRSGEGHEAEKAGENTEAPKHEEAPATTDTTHQAAH